MINIPLLEANAIIDGTINHPLANSISINNFTKQPHKINEGTLFFYMPEKCTDKAHILKKLSRKGLAAVVLDKQIEDLEIPQIIVPSTSDALNNLKKEYKNYQRKPLINIAGSIGKTASKKIISHILKLNSKANIRFHENNFTSVKLKENTTKETVLKSETSSSNFYVVTNTGISNIEYFKSRKNIAKQHVKSFAKASKNDILILNRDDDFYEYYKRKSICKIISVGMHKNADIRISNLKADTHKLFFNINGLPVSVSNCSQKYNTYNIAVGYAIASEMGLKQEDILQKINAYKCSEKESKISLLKNGTVILDYSHNTKPELIMQSFEDLHILKSRTARRVFVVVDELWKKAAYNKEAYAYLEKIITGNKHDIDCLISVGKHNKCLGVKNKIENVLHFSNNERVTHFLNNEIKGGDVVLLYGINGFVLSIVKHSLKHKFGAYGMQKQQSA